LEKIKYIERINKEKEWISFIGRNQLTNSTDGGEGTCGLKHSEETRKLISILKTGNENMLGHHHTEETKKIISEKISEILKGRFPSEETKRKISESNKGKHQEWLGKKHKPESIEKMKKSHTPEEKFKMMGIKRKNATSKYIGVSFDKARNKWTVRILINGKPKSLGRFDSEIEAAKIYDKYALLYYGDKAKLNFKENNNDSKNN
jgi:hypothetical protein